MLCSGNHIADNFVDLCTSNVYQFLTKPIIRHKLHNALLDTIGFKMTTPHRPLQDAPQPSLPQDDKGLILLVDDQEVNQKVGRYMLQDLGYQVETANNGQEALNKLQNVHYDLILMDCHMPEMDGFEATRLIRHQEQSLGLQPVPIIALTADVQAGIVEECQQAGMNAYLSKPFNLQQLENILKTQLQDKPII